MSSQNATARQPQRERGRLRVAALMDAAIALFSEQGFEATTMTAIAARAGASIGSLYQFFPTKEHMADALLTDHAEALFQRMQALVAESATWPLAAVAGNVFPALMQFRADYPAFGVLLETPRGPVLQATGVRQRMRGYVTEILRPHASHLSAAELETVAVIVLQTMKTAVALNAETDLPQRNLVLDQLRDMLTLWLTRKLVGTPPADDR